MLQAMEPYNVEEIGAIELYVHTQVFIFSSNMWPGMRKLCFIYKYTKYTSLLQTFCVSYPVI